MKNALIKPVLKAGVLAVLTAGLILPMTRVSAQNIDNFEGAEAKKPTTVFDVSVGTTYRTETEVDTGGDPEFSVFGIRVGGGGTFQLSEQLMLNTGANYEYAGYDWSGVSADPWEEVFTWSPARRSEASAGPVALTPSDCAATSRGAARSRSA